MTISDVLENFGKYVRKELSDNTAITYISSIKNLYMNVLNIKDLDSDFVIPSIDDIYEFMSDTSDSKKFIMKYALKSFDAYLKENKYGSIDIPEIKNYDTTGDYNLIKETDIYKIAKQSDLMTACFILLAYEHLYKLAQIINIKDSDVDLIHHTIMDEKMSLELSSFMFDYTSELENDINRWNESRIKRGLKPREELGYFFQSRQGAISKNMPNKKVGKAFTEILDKCSIEDIRWSRKAKLIKQFGTFKAYQKGGGDYNQYVQLNEYMNDNKIEV